MEVLGKTVAAVDRVAVVDIAVDMVAADHTVWVLVVEVPAGLVDHFSHFDLLGLEVLLAALKPVEGQLLALHGQPFCTKYTLKS